jgi:hypothetical protein
MKVFISQVMRDKTKEEILLERESVIKYVRKIYGESAEIIDSYFGDYNPQTGSIPLKFLAKSLELLADADLAIFCRNWEHARGCIIEHQCAVSYGIDVEYM